MHLESPILKISWGRTCLRNPLKDRTSGTQPSRRGTNGASPPAEPLHSKLPNATEKSAYPIALAGNKSPVVFISFTHAGRSLKVILWLLKLSVSLPFFQDRVILGHFTSGEI